jgi:hypothetical protein
MTPECGTSFLHYLGEPTFILSCALNIQMYQRFISSSTKSADIHVTTLAIKI